MRICQLAPSIAALTLFAHGASSPVARASGTLELTQPTQLCVGPATRAPCRAAREVQRWLESERLEIVTRRPSGGAQGAVKLRVRAGEVVFDAKWRDATTVTDDDNPVGELGAHYVQSLVLDPRDYVAAPTASHCLKASEHARWLHGDLSSTDGDCVLGIVSFWLTGAVGLGEVRRDHFVDWQGGDVWDADPALYDAARFPSQSPAFRRNIANLNLIAFLVHNGDAHTAQFAVYRQPLHVFLVDHSVAFSTPERVTMRTRQSLARLVVPAIPADTAARVVKLDDEDVMGLMRLEEHRLIDGAWRHVPLGPLIDAGRERVRRDGDRIQVGLSREDALGVRARVHRVREMLDDGTLQTFD